MFTLKKMVKEKEWGEKKIKLIEAAEEARYFI